MPKTASITDPFALDQASEVSEVSEAKKIKPVPKRKHIKSSVRENHATRQKAKPVSGLRQTVSSAKKSPASPRTPSKKLAHSRTSRSEVLPSKKRKYIAKTARVISASPPETRFTAARESTDPCAEEEASDPLGLRRQRFLFRRTMLTVVCAVGMLLVLGAAHQFGRLSGRSEVKSTQPVRIKPDNQALLILNEACRFLKAGQAAEASQILAELANRASDIPSLAYLRALTALQLGDFSESRRFAGESLERGERVSDSLVILSMAEVAGAGGIRDAKVVRESKLREAIEADPANPAPMVDLANTLRGTGRSDEALQLLKAANSRLHPVDPHIAVETSIRLLELQALPDGKLPEPVSEGQLPELFASLYIALRLQRHDAAGLLEAKCRQRSAPDLFAYITADPAFREFRALPVTGSALF